MEKLYLGVAREIITPKIGCQLYGYRPDIFSSSVADELTATAFYFKQGDTCALMISTTVCLIKTSLAQSIIDLISQKFNIPKENCILSATHTHSGPNTAGETGWGDIDNDYCNNIFIPQILIAVEKAVFNTQPVKMGTANGTSKVGINRLELDLNNEIVLGQNPWGCFDSRMTVISFINEQNENVANIIHYGAHGTAAGGNEEITRDWSGVMVDALEDFSGAITAFFNGPEGDVGPRLSNGRTTGDLKFVQELGSVAAQDAVRIFKKIFSYTYIDLSVSNKNLLIPLKKRKARDEAKTLYKKYMNLSVNIDGMIKKHLEDVINSYETDFNDKEYLELNQTVIALGDIVLAAFPYETFSEIGLRIDSAFKNKSILSLSNTNGSEGYFVTQDAICRGGYEVDMFLYGHIQPFVDDADYYLIKETVEHIKSI